MSELYINGKDALSVYRIRMGRGFIAALRQPANYKEFISNKSRLEPGVRYIVGNPMLDERELTLPFVLMTKSPTLTGAYEKLFLIALKGNVDIRVPSDSSATYHLIMVGVASYSLNTKRNILQIKVKFKEPNPNDRNAD